MITLTSRFNDAIRYAEQVHAGQTRKGTDVPYLGHLLGVASLVLDDGGGEEEAIGALLHDAAERGGGQERLEDIRRQFGSAVAQIVSDCTDSWTGRTESWLERKTQYLARARTLPPPSVRVSAADKVHNAYTLLRELRTIGDRVWERYDARPDDVVWYYQSLVRSFRAAGGGPLVEELERIVHAIEREMGY